MQARIVEWNGKCLIVMLQPSGKSDKRRRALETAVKDSASACDAPGTLYEWMRVSADGKKYFSAWNIGHPGLLCDLLRKRSQGEVDFLAYYRFCGGISTVKPEGNFFRDS